MSTLTEDKPGQQTATSISDDLVAIARQLAAESHSQHIALDDININSDIARDLGFDSLARVELFSRINKNFGVDLDDVLFAEAVILRDLLPAISKVRAKVSPAVKPRVKPKTGETGLLATPDDAQTLVDVLRWYTERYPERDHIQLYDDEDAGEIVSYQHLLVRTQEVAAGLQSLGVGKQHPVAIMLPTGTDYFYSFFGILLAGCIPVPLYPPARPSQLEDHIRRHASILNNCQPVILITVPEAKILAHLLRSQVESIKHVVTVEELRSSDKPWLPCDNKSEDIAFIQYTSGSTGTPKGVVLTHRNLLANIRAMGAMIKANSDDVFVSWLPLYHDMGLIGAWLGSMYFAARFVVMSPLAFLSKPQRWLWAIHRYGGTLSASPNFGYELCVRRIADEDLQNLVLSSWRAAFNGAEPVSPDTVKRFCDRFEVYGFRREAYLPVYGLAENSVGLSFPPLNRGPLIDRVQRDVFMQTGEARLALDDDANAIEFVSCGRVLLNHQIRIVDNNNKEVFNRHEGRLQFRGPSATSGYYHNPDKTQALFCDDWLESGDLAYIANDELYLTGRTKDVIIRGGRNIYPHELEDAIGNIDGVRNGRVAVFGTRAAQSGTEKLVVLAETREPDQATLQLIRSRINEIVNDLAGLPPDDVVLAPPGTILKTSSGKLRRAASKTLYEEGRIGKSQLPMWWQLTRLAWSGLKAQLRHYWRGFIELSYGIYAHAIFWILAPLTWVLVVVSPSIKFRWFIMRAATRTLAVLTGVRLSAIGREHLPQPSQSVVYVANHASYMDGPLVITMIDRSFSFIAKAELAMHIISHLFLKRIHAKFVERFDVQKSVEDSNQILEELRPGESLFFFPEGTFRREEGLLPFRMGAFVVAAEAGLPIVPVTINGSRKLLQADEWLPRRYPIEVVISPEIDPASAPDKNDTWATAIWLRDQVRKQILKNYAESDTATH